jgi:AraC family transcriptional regulator of adaptative response / DNA-3-methyladenine glycosylase II
VDVQACLRAMASRDRRFDGRFVVAVRTTGIYCRPSCPAVLPRPENVRFFTHAAAAGEAGFRACHRCRPELSPEIRPDTSRTVARAVRLITEGALDEDGGIADLATRLGVGDRHLRRLFAKHLGASPIALAQTRRTHFARRLLDETDLSITDVALGAGFSSVRRFNDVFRRTFSMPPSAVRSLRQRPQTGELRLRLPYVPPYDWASMIGFLRERAIPGVERVEDAYCRSIEVAGVEAGIEVRHEPRHHCLDLRILAPLPTDLLRIVGRVRRLFDLDCDPMRLARHLRRDTRLAGVVRKQPGLRLPGAWDPFELAVGAILDRQVPVRAASAMTGRVVSLCGTPATVGLSGITHCFPSASRLSEADLSSIGLPPERADAIRGVARAIVGRSLVLDGSRGLDETVAALCALPGIGDWTAQYIAMRALAEPDAFPAGDPRVRKALSANGKLPDRRAILRCAEAWRPFRAYAVLHLWRSLA